MARGAGLQPRPVSVPVASHPPARGCSSGDHHEGCGHVALRARSSALRVAQPDEPLELAAETAATRVREGRRAFDDRPPGPSRTSPTTAAALRPAGPGRPLDLSTRREGEATFDTDLSSVRVHDDDRADALSRHLGADAFTVGSDIYFRRGLYGSPAPQARHVVNHELAHVSLGAGGEVIARHASWEHKMLGDVDPADLEVIAAGRDLVAERKLAKKEKRPEKTLTITGGQPVDADMVLHTIEQEIDRLQTFARNPPTVASKAEQNERNDADLQRQVDKAKERAEGADDADVQAPARRWDVRLVALPLRDGSKAILTYGEVNTLADFYGSPKEITETDPQQFRNYVYGIREESIRKFMRFHNEISKGLGRDKIYDADSDQHKVQDATATSMGNTGTSGSLVVGGVAGGDAYAELKMMGKLPGANTAEKAEKKYEVPGKPETAYTAGLARNACHFAPQSWHAWGSAHESAVALARQSYALAKPVQDAVKAANASGRMPRPQQVEAWRPIKEQADELKNRALIENGFGDHFLQDSYAAGHLINKTLIMQWFAQWLDEHGRKRDYTAEEKWRQVQNMAYDQPGLAAKQLYDAPIGTTRATDAQSVENITQVGGRAAVWQDRFKALGLTLPNSLRRTGTPEFELFTWWQEQAGRGKYLSSNINELQKISPIVDRGELTSALNNLISDGVVYYDSYSTKDRAKGPQAIGLTTLGVGKSLRLKKEYIPTDQAGFANTMADVDQGDTSAYANKAGAATYADYHTFLNHGYLQLSTNVLHDYFCKNGLWVNLAAGVQGYKIYGDNSMLQKESSTMVGISAETSRMSRNSIYEYAEQGATDNTTAAIASRIPKYVTTAKDGLTVSLEDWHEEDKSKGLKKLCWQKVFPDVAALFSKSTAVASDTLAPKVSGDVESGEPF